MSEVQTAPKGWHPDPEGRYTHRYWDGSTWTLLVSDDGLTKLDAYRVERVLEPEVERYVSQGWRIESRTPTQVVAVWGHRPNHLLHLVLSVLTVGLWAIFVWLPIGLFGGEKRCVLTVDRLGKIVTS